jgi:hypothetical protein
MPIKLKSFVLPSYFILKKIPNNLLKDVLDVSYQNKFNMIHNDIKDTHRHYEEDIKFLSKHFSNIENLKSMINIMPDLTEEQIEKQENNPKNAKIIRKNELLLNADKHTQENRIKRKCNLDKFSKEEQEQIINDRIEEIINNVSKSECNIEKIKFIIKEYT